MDGKSGRAAAVTAIFAQAYKWCVSSATVFGAIKERSARAMSQGGSSYGWGESKAEVQHGANECIGFEASVARVACEFLNDLNWPSRPNTYRPSEEREALLRGLIKAYQ